MSAGGELTGRLTSAAAEESLRRSRVQLEAFIRHAPISIAMFDPDMNYLATSDRWVKEYGRGYRELVGRNHYQVHPDLPQWWKDVHRAGLAGETLKNDEELWLQADGSKHWLRWAVLPWRDEGGSIGGIIISAEDITDRKRAENELRESEERYSAIFERAPFPMALSSAPDGVTVAVNEAFLRLFEYERHEVLGKTSTELKIAGVASRSQVSEELLARGLVRDFECTRTTKSGAQRILLLNLDPVDIGGKKHVLTTIRDITERMQAEEARRKNEELQQVAAVAQANVSISEAVASLPEMSVRAVLDTIALNAQSLTSAEFAAVGIGSDPARSFETWAFSGVGEEEAARIGRPPRPVGLLGLVTRENRTVRLRDLRQHPEYRGFPPNHPVMTSFLGAPIRYRGKAVGNLYLANKRGADEFTAQDQGLVEMLAARAGVAIETARLYAAEGTGRAWLHAVVDQMPEGIVIMDAQGRVTVENRSVLALAGPTSEQTDRFGNPATLDLQRPSGEPLSPDELPIVKAILQREPTQGLELLARRADGRLVPLLVSAAPIRAANGETVGATMVLQDITPLKELEQLREEWASIVAHDLQQPINSIVLRTDLLLRSGLADRQSDDVRQVRAAAKRLGRMANDLMDASQIETHRLQVSLERLDLGQLVSQVIERIPDAAARTRVRKPTDRQLFIRGDADRLEQVLANLVSNALKYGDPDAEIVVDVQEVRGHAEVSVENRGPGIPGDELPLLFERFVRSRAARTSATKGSGLGLYIAKGLVEAHGGRMWAESRPGEATIFRFVVPLDGPPALPGPCPPHPEETGPAP